MCCLSAKWRVCILVCALVLQLFVLFRFCSVHYLNNSGGHMIVFTTGGGSGAQYFVYCAIGYIIKRAETQFGFLGVCILSNMWHVTQTK
jgi:hypothetical protein